MNRTHRIHQHPPEDPDWWVKLYYKHQQHSRRRRLFALKSLWEGQSIIQVCRSQGIARDTLNHWIDAYLEGGFKALLSPQKRPRAQRLSPEQRQSLREMITGQTPHDYGIDSYQWTGKGIQSVLEQRWQVHLNTSRIYEILDELGLSHQRVHRDYGPYVVAEREAYVADLKQKVEVLPADATILAVDEFALQSQTCTHYGWAEKNSKPTVPSNEARRQKTNGFLAVDLKTGITQVDFEPRAKIDNVVSVLGINVLRCIQSGYRSICFLLDNCSIHNATMQAALLLLLSQVAMAQGVTITFMKTPKYSPNFNPAEYVIHLIRQRSLYNLPQDMSIDERAERIKLHLAQGPPPLLPEQVGHLLHHIYTLPVDKK